MKKKRIVKLEPQTVELFAEVLSKLRPPPPLTVSQWADRYRVLSAESSAEPGRWHTEKAPYQRAIMDAIGDPHVRSVVVMSAAQIGKTDAFILNSLGYYMDYAPCPVMCMENILKVFLMAFPEWLACIFMVVGLVVTALAAVRLGYGLVVAKTVYKWIVNAEEKFGSGAGAEKKAHVIAVLRGYTPDWLDWAINERTLDWIVQLVFDFTKKKLEDYMAKKSAETTTVAHFGNVGENKRND